MIKNNNKILFEKYKLGDLTLSNRIVMASMSRGKSDPKTGVATDLHVLYYSQRATAGLIMTESSPIASNAFSYPGAAAIYTQEQAQAWKRVTDAVHKKGAKMFCQLWHAGRTAHPNLTGEKNIAPSAIAVQGELLPGFTHQVPQEMTKSDIKEVLRQYKQAAIYAKEAGFDGVELHGGYGYLVEQFLKESSNHRTDEYGGSVENRARFCLEAIDQLIAVYGANRVGIKLTPVSKGSDMSDSDPLTLYTYLMKQLDRKGIVYVQLVEPGDIFAPGPGEPDPQMPNVSKTLRPFFKRTIIINNKQTSESAAKTILEGNADLVSFAKSFISNPDLVERLRNGWPLASPDFASLRAPGEKGYSDYIYYKPEKKPSGGLFACCT